MSKEIDLTKSREPVWTELATRDQETLVWDALYSARSLITDADDARRAADQVVELLRRGRAYNKQGLVDARRERRARRWRKVRSWLAGLTTLAVVAAGASVGGYAIWKVHANDYAGVDPATVKSASAGAINRWFGQNDLPANLQIISQTHSHLYGKKAWFVLYNGDRRGPVCVYVWGGAKGNYEKVETGKACGRASS